MSVFSSSGWDDDRLNSLGWNKFWKDEFGLADRQLNLAELDALEGFNTKWSRNSAVSYFLNPTLGNALRMGVSEALSSWTNPELVVAGLSMGIAGWQGIGGKAVKGGTQVAEQATVHGNSLKSLRSTWGYKLYSTDGTFLKNGITSKLVPEGRYTKAYMSDKYMTPVKQFPNRLEAWQWEFQQNKILRGPLNKNMH